ncbi:desmin-like [Alosa alosa]|nr:desmin-like [Alosa alosa]
MDNMTEGALSRSCCIEVGLRDSSMLARTIGWAKELPLYKKGRWKERDSVSSTNSIGRNKSTNPRVIMSRSPERISSYRRHFEGALTASSSTSLQVRVSSPSPTRRDNRTRSASSASYSRSGTMGRRAMSGSRRMAGGASMGGMSGMAALCVGMGGVDLDAAAAENQAFMSTRTSERQEMVTLNDRLAIYIEKVRSLESQNKLLEAEIDAIQNRYTKPSGLRKLYEEQLREMMRVAEQMRMQRDLAFAAKDAMAGQLEMLKVKYEEAVEARKKVEMDIVAFRPDVDAATAARIALEKQLDNLERELEFLQRLHKQEIEELMAQIYGGMSKVDVAFGLPDLSAALKDIQAQYDSIAAKNLQEMDSWYKNKFQDMNQASTSHVDRSRSVREEITGAKRDIANKERDLEALKTRNEGLEAQIREAQERYKKEEEDLLARIEAVKLELQGIKSKITMMLKEYQDLLNLKMALEIEITTYRKLIEGEDLRLDTMVRHGGMSLMGSGMGGGMATMGARGMGMNGSGMSAGSVMNGSAMGMGMGAMSGSAMSASGKSASAGAMSASMGAVGMGTDMVGGAAMASGTSSSMSATQTSGSMEMESKTMSSSNGMSTMMSSSNGMSKTVSSTNGAMSMSSSSKAEFSEEQAVEMTERKTVLIRTVKTDEDEILSDTQERTFTISGAADDM